MFSCYVRLVGWLYPLEASNKTNVSNEVSYARKQEQTRNGKKKPESNEEREDMEEGERKKWKHGRRSEEEIETVFYVKWTRREFSSGDRRRNGGWGEGELIDSNSNRLLHSSEQPDKSKMLRQFPTSTGVNHDWLESTKYTDQITIHGKLIVVNLLNRSNSVSEHIRATLNGDDSILYVHCTSNTSPVLWLQCTNYIKLLHTHIHKYVASFVDMLTVQLIVSLKCWKNAFDSEFGSTIGNNVVSRATVYIEYCE